MIFKFNGGRGAVLCKKCGKIVYTLSAMPNDLKDSVFNRMNYGKTYDDLPPVYCDDCMHLKLGDVVYATKECSEAWDIPTGSRLVLIEMPSSEIPNPKFRDEAGKEWYLTRRYYSYEEKTLDTSVGS